MSSSTNTRITDEWGSFSAIPNEFIDAAGDLSDQSRWLFVLLRRYTNGQTGKAFPSYKAIQERTGWTPKTIAKAVRELEEAGWIEREKTFGDVTQYILKRNRHFPQGSEVLPVGKRSTSRREVGVLPVGKSNKTDITRSIKQTDKEREAQPRQALVVTQAASITTPHTQGGADAVSIALEHFPQLGIWQQELIEKADINHGILWRQCCERWRDNRYSIRNITGLIDSYHKMEIQDNRERNNNGKNGHSKRESHNERAARESFELIRRLTGQESSPDSSDPADTIFKLPAAFGGR
jgi:DNA-binding Lrp family transcriptional regulator